MYAQCQNIYADRATAGAEWLTHKAKIQLLNERIKAIIEAAHGKELDALADAIIGYVKENQAESESAQKKRQSLQEAFDELFS